MKPRNFPGRKIKRRLRAYVREFRDQKLGNLLTPEEITWFREPSDIRTRYGASRRNANGIPNQPPLLKEHKHA
jgi:hypothetical protein